MESKLGSAVVRSVRLVEISLPDQVRGTLLVTGEKAVMEHALEMVRPRKYQLDQINLFFQRGAEPLRILATSTSAITFNHRPDEETRLEVWKCIQRVAGRAEG
jgi:hypothetical protein